MRNLRNVLLGIVGSLLFMAPITYWTDVPVWGALLMAWGVITLGYMLGSDRVKFS